MKNERQNTYSLLIENGTVEIKGITGVAHYSEKELCFVLNGGTLNIAGSGLNMESLNVEGGFALVKGEVSSVKYKKGAISLLKKLSR